ncbi:MAG: helix-turn-helix transcriptional regulator [Clostridia bacterium]
MIKINIERLKLLRTDKGYSQLFIANILKINLQIYSEYEIGKIKIPSKYLSLLADFYEVSTDYLLNRTDEKKPYSKKKITQKNNKF